MLPRDEVVRGFPVEVQGFADLVRPLEARDWAQPSRCAGWTVGEVVGHVIGALADITAGRIEGLGTPEVSDRQVAERRGAPLPSWPTSSTASARRSRRSPPASMTRPGPNPPVGATT